MADVVCLKAIMILLPDEGSLVCAQEPDEELQAESGYEVGQPSRLVYAPPAGTWENENPEKSGAGFKKDIIQEAPKAYRQKIFFKTEKYFSAG